MKKIYLILIGVGVLAVLAFVILLFYSQKDSWVKDENGIYVKQGNSSEISDEVLAQEEMILDALKLYYEKADEGVNFSSQCLGTVDGYAVDIVHVPRSTEDDWEENQCEDYRNGKVNHFIELDRDGDVVRIK